MVFIHDTERVPTPPRSMAAMATWAASHPGRLAHPSAGDVVGAAFLERALIELTPDRTVLARPATDATYAVARRSFWSWYEALLPHLWAGGQSFPASGPAQATLFANGEIDLYPSLNPGEAASGIANGALSATARAYVPDGGTLCHCSYVAIPRGAAHYEAAMVLADFLLSPEAQAHAADPLMLGSPTVLDLERLVPEDRSRFTELLNLPGKLTEAGLGVSLPEPHPSWMARITAEWEWRAMLCHGVDGASFDERPRA